MKHHGSILLATAIICTVVIVVSFINRNHKEPAKSFPHYYDVDTLELVDSIRYEPAYNTNEIKIYVDTIRSKTGWTFIMASYKHKIKYLQVSRTQK